mgnify:CR=1 FL=1
MENSRDFPLSWRSLQSVTRKISLAKMRQHCLLVVGYVLVFDFYLPDYDYLFDSVGGNCVSANRVVFPILTLKIRREVIKSSTLFSNFLHLRIRKILLIDAEGVIVAVVGGFLTWRVNHRSHDRYDNCSADRR